MTTLVVTPQNMKEHYQNSSDFRDKIGFTPLHEAAHSDHLKICQLIMENSKDKNPRDEVGCTPFHLAAQEGHFRICGEFIGN